MTVAKPGFGGRASAPATVPSALWCAARNR